MKKLLEVSTHTPSSFFHDYSGFYPRHCDVAKIFCTLLPAGAGFFTKYPGLRRDDGWGGGDDDTFGVVSLPLPRPPTLRYGATPLRQRRGLLCDYIKQRGIWCGYNFKVGWEDCKRVRAEV
ncbi:MAG: hypothetical protein LBB23_02680 [Rickettsiales bacterium]|nr:hypothetical protein [Rickettsiales bacterium]